MRKFRHVWLFVTVWWLNASAQQFNEYLTVEIPIGAQAATNALWVKWAGVSRPGFSAPDSGHIYFNRSPGGGKLSNYRYKVVNPYVDSLTNEVIDNKLYNAESPNTRAIAFRPVDQPEMGTGVFYCVVALPVPGFDTLCSNEFQILVESPDAVTMKTPSGEITSLTPTFVWDVNPGVPYYHLILSDQSIKVDTTDSGKIDLQGLSIIWQAITPNTQMLYGAPDPSNTITADPPPLSTGQNYTWIVLNNYGNHPAFTSTRYGSINTFKIKGIPLKKPRSIYPVNVQLNSSDNKDIQFKWTDLDTNANTYKVYVYVGQELDGMKAQMIVWQTEVMATSSAETLGVNIDAASILTSNHYAWRVIAIDDKGAGTTGDTVSFNYTVPTGAVRIKTREQISVTGPDGTTIAESPVGLAKIEVEVLDGSMEAPLLFYTDIDGYLLRDRSAGTYRITAVKDEFESQTKTIVVSKNDTTSVTFFLQRPEATIYGKVVDESKKGINLANVYGISDRGDTVFTQADASGNFVLRCYGADWNIGAKMTGYKSVLPEKITVVPGENLSFGTVTMEKNPYTLSGIVKNGSGATLLGVNVRLLRDNVVIDEIPSTPQSGSFSFAVPSGSYTVTAEKTGFTSYSGNVDLLSSKSISISMQAGATLVRGYVYGKTWVGERQIIAPITRASVKFISVGSTDTISVISDVTYGDFNVSLPGDKSFLVYSSANGFISKAIPCSLKTQIKTTQAFNDTLQGLGMISGTVKYGISELGNASVSLISVSSGEVVVSGKTSANGHFEMRNIYDGNYMIRAGKDGYILDSIEGPDTLNVSNGKADPAQTVLFMKPGNKTIKWSIAGIENFSGSIKIKSPLQKTLPVSDSLSMSGPGIYVVTVDAAADSLIDLEYHRFNVLDSEMVHVDTVLMDVIHRNSGILTPVNGRVTLKLSSVNVLDSVVLYYKDAVASVFRTARDISSTKSYTFNILPPRDGSTMLYYFKAYRNKDVYGYDKETYQSFVKPDTSSLTKFEILPSSDDTLVYASNSSVRMTFKGYYSSAFLPDSSIDDQSISWKLTNPHGCSLVKTKGLEVTVKMGDARAFSTPVMLTATVDTNRTRVIGTARSVSTVFRVSGTDLKSITINRIDAGSPAISAFGFAEFIAEGKDSSGTVLALSPAWSVYPQSAGTISSRGVFRPYRKFSGSVRIFAEMSGVRGEYKAEGKDENGLEVQFMIVKKSTPDTAINGLGCTVIFPANAIESFETGLLKIATASLKNQIRRGNSLYRTVDSIAFDLTEINNVSFNLSHDSIRLELDIPSELRKQVSKQEIKIACWSEDSLKWQMLSNSVISEDKTKISAGITHFSQYSVLLGKGNSGYLKISPNPFSPYVWPRSINPTEKHLGACIEFQIDNESTPNDVKLRIYNVVGDLVWSLHIQNADGSAYTVWWDGRTSDREIIWTKPGYTIEEQGSKMCRNGRYFVVLHAKDTSNKEWRYMKQIVLFK